jgi:cytochrome P450
MVAAKSHDTLAAFTKVALWGTIAQVSLRFMMLRPLIWFFLPPSIATLMPKLLRMNRTEVRNRLKKRNQLEHPDLFEYLLEKDKPDPPEDWLLSHANVLIVAGFDPHTNLSSSMIYFLARNPDKLKIAVEEVRGTFTNYHDITADALQNLIYLQAVLNESLRIHTNAAFGLPRICPGAIVDGHAVPTGVSQQIML